MTINNQGFTDINPVTICDKFALRCDIKSLATEVIRENSNSINDGVKPDSVPKFSKKGSHISIIVYPKM